MIKEFIINNFVCEQMPKIGIDGKYHTVYLIQFKNEYFYIGKHSSKNASNDRYFCSGYLPNQLKNSGFEYDRFIISYLDSSELALLLESKILSNTQIYDNDFCLNCTQYSPPSSYGTIVVSKNNQFKMIKKTLLHLFLERGWQQSGISRIWIYKNLEQKFILSNELEAYLSDNWKLGCPKAKNRIFVKKGTQIKFIKKDDLNFFLKEGWEIKHTHTGKKVLEKNNKKFFIDEDLVNEFLLKGYVKSSSIKNLIWIKKDKQHKRVSKEQLESYVQQGWKIGSNKSGQIYVTDGIKEKRIYKDEIESLPFGWVVGRTKKVILTNGIIERRIQISNEKEIANLLCAGFVIGSLRRNRKR